MNMLGNKLLPQMHGGGYLLDGISDVVAAYSLRKLRSSYEGAAVRVRRSSDSAEQDIGFDGGEFDSAAFSSFVGGGTGYITAWYDQSEGNNATQSNATLQPVLALNAINNLPAIRSNTDQYLTISPLSNVISWVIVTKHASGSQAATAILGHATLYDYHGGYTGINGDDYLFSSVDAAATVRNGTLRENGTVKSTLTYKKPITHVILSLIATGNTNIGNISRDRLIASKAWNGDFLDIILLSDALSQSNHNKIGQNAANQYGISWNDI